MCKVRETLSSVFMSDRPQAAGRRFLTGLIGAPIAHSASPAMHERAAAALGAQCFYQLIEVEGADREGLRALLDGVRRLGFAGVNVTFPYKEAVIGLLDELSPGAAAMGAVNTVVVRDNRLIGHNTDATGFAQAAQQKLTPALKRVMMQPAPVVRAGIRALQSGRISVVPGWANKVVAFLARATPRRLNQAIFSRVMNG